MIMYDDTVWWSCIMIIIYDDHVWWKFWRTNWNASVSSNMFGDVWDMFWHHYWCLGNYLEPLSINLLPTKINRSNKTRNNLIVIFHWSDNSKVSSEADLYTCPFSFLFYFLILFDLRGGIIDPCGSIIDPLWRHNFWSN